MTVGSNPLFVRYVGDGVTTVFELTTEFLRDSVVYVEVDKLLKTEGTDYVLTKFGTTTSESYEAYTKAIITFTTPVGLGSVVYIYITTPVTQLIPFSELQNAITRGDIEHALDKIVIIEKQINEVLVKTYNMIVDIGLITPMSAIPDRLLAADGKGSFYLTIPFQMPTSAADAGKTWVIDNSGNYAKLQALGPGFNNPVIPQLPTDEGLRFVTADKDGYKYWLKIPPISIADAGATFTLAPDLASVIFKQATAHGVLPVVDSSDKGKFSQVVVDQWDTSSYTLPTELLSSDIGKVLGVVSATEVGFVDVPPDLVASTWFTNSILEGCVISLVTPTVPTDPVTQVSITAGKAIFLSDTPGVPATRDLITIPAVATLTISNITSADNTYLVLNKDGTISQQPQETYFQRGTRLLLGKVFHPNRTSIIRVKHLYHVANNLPQQIRTSMLTKGNVVLRMDLKTNGSNTLEHGGGLFIGYDVNVDVNIQSPHMIQLPLLSPLPIQFIDSKGNISAQTTTFPDVPKVEESDGTVVDLIAGRVGYYQVWLSQNNTLMIQYSNGSWTPTTAPLLSEYLLRTFRNDELLENYALVGMVIWEFGKTFLTGNVYTHINGTAYQSASQSGGQGVPAGTPGVDDDKVYQSKGGAPKLGIRIPLPNPASPTEFDGKIPVYTYGANQGFTATDPSTLFSTSIGDGPVAFVIGDSPGNLSRYLNTSPSPFPHFGIQPGYEFCITDFPTRRAARVSVELMKWTLNNIANAPHYFRLNDWITGVDQVVFPQKISADPATPFNFLSPAPVSFPLLDVVFTSYNNSLTTPAPSRILFTRSSNQLIDSFTSATDDLNIYEAKYTNDIAFEYMSSSETSRFEFTHDVTVVAKEGGVGMKYNASMAMLYIDTTKLKTLASDYVLDLTWTVYSASATAVTDMEYMCVTTGKDAPTGVTDAYIPFENKTVVTSMDGPTTQYFHTSVAATGNSNRIGAGILIKPKTSTVGKSTTNITTTLTLRARSPSVVPDPERNGMSRFEYIPLKNWNALVEEDGIVLGEKVPDITAGRLNIYYLTFGLGKFSVTGKASIKPQYRGVIMNVLNQIADNTYPRFYLEKPGGTERVEAEFIHANPNNWGCHWIFPSVTQEQIDTWVPAVYLWTKDVNVVAMVTETEAQIGVMNY